MVSVRTLLLEHVDLQGASHISELHIEILNRKPGTPEHTVRARLSEAVKRAHSDRGTFRLRKDQPDLYISSGNDERQD